MYLRQTGEICSQHFNPTRRSPAQTTDQDNEFSIGDIEVHVVHRVDVPADRGVRPTDT